jgi:hypothetical protein
MNAGKHSAQLGLLAFQVEYEGVRLYLATPLVSGEHHAPGAAVLQILEHESPSPPPQ